MATINGIRRSLEDGENSISKYLKTESGFHGTMYHIKLMMLLMIRGFKIEEKFEIACEYKLAGKFDDIAYIYFKFKETEKFMKFLQAKHRQGNNNQKITYTYLCNKKGIDLKKYYISYENTIHGRKLNAEKIEEIILVSNIQLENGFRTRCDEHDSYMFQNGVKVYNFKEDLKRDFKGHLSSVNILWNIAKDLASYWSENKKISKQISKDSLLLFQFRRPLLEQVINCENDKFHTHFISNDDNETLQAFREYLENDFNINLSEVKFCIHNNFKEHFDENDRKEFPKPSSDSVTIDSFLEKLKIYTTPDEDDLKRILKEEIKGIKFFNAEQDQCIEIIYSRFLEKILEWFKTKEGILINLIDVQNIINDIKKELIPLPNRNNQNYSFSNCNITFHM